MRWKTYVLVLPIASGAIRVVKRFQDLRTQDVVAARDVKSRALIELCLVLGHFARIPAKALRPNAGQSLVVSVLATGDKLEAEIDVLLLLQNEAAEDEVAAVKAGEVARFEFECSVVERGQVG
jgi:hypothetical protein